MSLATTTTTSAATTTTTTTNNNIYSVFSIYSAVTEIYKCENKDITNSPRTVQISDALRRN